MEGSDAAWRATTPDAPPAHADIEDMLAGGRTVEAVRAVTHHLAADPADAESWFLLARIRAADGDVADAAEACARALALWPDIQPVHRLALDLARRTADPATAIRALERLLADRPDDPHLCGELAGLLCQQDEHRRALPFLRIAAPVLLHENSTIWNYTLSLARAGLHAELLEAQPLLDRMAQTVSTPYTPYRHLASARLALRFDRADTIAEQEALEASVFWCRPPEILDRISTAIASQDPFSLVCLDQDMSYFTTVSSLRANLVLRPQEVAAIGDAVWGKWFDRPFQSTPPAWIAALAEQVRVVLADADIVGVPDAQTLRFDNLHFGMLAEMQRLVLRRSGQAWTGFGIMQALHEAAPFLRPVLQRQPFLGFVGAYPDLARKLAHFCAIDETAVVPVSARDSADPGLPGACREEEAERALAELVVPFRGALFLVAVPGPLGIAFCGRIKALGGIALDIGAIAPIWAAR